MRVRIVATNVMLAGTLVVLSSGQAGTQGNAQAKPSPAAPPQSTGVNGSGTPGTVPLWTGSGRTLTNAHIQDDGTSVNVTLPLQASGSGDAAGVSGFGVQFGVLGFASSGSDASWAVKGGAAGNGVGVEGDSSTGVGVRGSMVTCDNAGCVPTIGDAGQFVAGAGGILLHGFLSNFNGPGGWDEKFKVDTSGNLSIYGNAFKPGGGSWSTLSDRRAKKSIEPISGALNRLLKLRGVTYEYANPATVGELPGTHLGMVAQDVEQVFPSWVDTGTDGYKRLTFRGFEAVAVEAVRELDEQVASNSKESMARIENLEQQNAQLRRAIEVLSETVKTLQRK